MSQNDLKLSVAKTALAYVPKGEIIGVGTGSTANFFIDELAKMKNDIKGAIASSEATASRLRSHNINVLELNEITSIPVYIDGADEINDVGMMIKGGGGALTREKIVASAADIFICIADESKSVKTLGTFPLPIEVIPMAYQLVSRKLAILGGQAKLRMKENLPFKTDNGNFILDVHNLQITDPISLENEINNYPGVVTVGLFAKRKADICLLGTKNGVKTLKF